MGKVEKLKGGLSDKKTLKDIATKHDKKGYYHIDDMIKSLEKQLAMGISVESEHTNDEAKAEEIAMDHLWEDPNYYKKLKKIETNEKWSEKYKNSIDCNNPKGFSQRAHCQGRKKTDTNEELVVKPVSQKVVDKYLGKSDQNEDCWKGYVEKGGKMKNGKLVPNCVPKKKETKEAMGADASGSFEPALSRDFLTKKQIYKIHNSKLNESEQEVEEALDASSSGGYDVPLFGKTPKGNRNPLKIDGPKSIYKGRAVKDKNFPKYGGPEGIYVKVKEKCKKFPYCNQGNTGALEFISEDREIKESIKQVAKESNLPYKVVENLVLNEINKIFINYEK